MKTRRLVTLVLIHALILCLAVTVSAQGPQPPTPKGEDSRVPPSPVGENSPQQAGPAAQPVAVGQPGLSYRYAQTFGQTDVFYVSDTTHLFYPSGLTTDGTSVWITEDSGIRALKFNGQTGTILSVIGQPGYRYANGASVLTMADVAVDASGNIWIVDRNVNDVLKFTSSAPYNVSLTLGQAFSAGNDSTRLAGPSGIAFDSAGNIYVSDGRNHRIQVFNSTGGYSVTIGITSVPTTTNAGFNTTRRIAIDSSNLLYVADQRNHRIQIFDVSNPAAISYVATLGTGTAGSDSAHLRSPQGVYVDASRIYVADTSNNRVQIFDRTSRAYLFTLGSGTAGSGNNQFNFPTDVAVNSAGSIFVADEGNFRVQQFDSGLSFVRTYGTTGVPYVTDNTHFNRPVGLAVATDGSMVLAEEAGDRLIKLDAAGVPQWAVGEAGVFGNDNAHFDTPEDVAIDPAGEIYVADAANNRIQIFNPGGSFSSTFGTSGSGNYQFSFPTGLYIAPDNTLYVVDNGNQRVQIYDSNRSYVATLGVTGVQGSDNAHFSSPVDVVVDGLGTIYVSDQNHHRVQVFDANRNYVRTMGATGVSRNDFGYFSGPGYLAVDARNNLYADSQFNHSIYMFDPTGAFLGVRGSSGSNTGNLRNPRALAFDHAGKLYIADYDNARVQKLAPGVPGWREANINGFGDRGNQIVSALSPFDGQLYAGTYNPATGNGAQIWRTSDGATWTPVLTNGFGITRNVGIYHLLGFAGQLYATTGADEINGGEVWRSSNGLNWTQVVNQGFGDTTNGAVFRLTVYSNTLYASTRSYTTTHGSELWRSNTGNQGDWTRVVTNGFDGDNNNIGFPASEVFNGYLYIGTFNPSTGGEVWRANDGATWTQVITDGFGTSNNHSVNALAAFNGYLYAGTTGIDGVAGVQVWRCQACDGSDWVKVVDNGFGNSNTHTGDILKVTNGRLYLGAGNRVTGMEVWSTSDGTNWAQVGVGGFGDSNNGFSYWDNSVAIFNNALYIGTNNPTNGGEIWQFLDKQLFLPEIRR